MKLSPWILCSCLASLLSFIKRTFFRFRRRRSSDPGLPTKNPVPPGSGGKPSTNGSSNSLYMNTPQAETSGVELDWDDWGDGAPMSIKIDPPVPTLDGHSTGAHNNPAPSHGIGSKEEEEEEHSVDYFTDMMPTFKKTVTIRKKTPQHITGPSSLTQGLSNRLTMGIDETAVLTDELGTWTEVSNAWEDETGDDLTWEAEQVIREKKMAEREKRAAEQRRKKMEKEAQRMVKKETSKLATKLK